MHSEKPKLYAILAFLDALGIKMDLDFWDAILDFLSALGLKRDLDFWDCLGMKNLSYRWITVDCKHICDSSGKGEIAIL